MSHTNESPNYPIPPPTHQRIEASCKNLPPGVEWGALPPVNPDERVEVSVIVKRRNKLPEGLAESGFRVDRKKYLETYAADSADIGAMRDFAAEYGLQVTAEHNARRTVKLSGTVAQLQRAFGMELRAMTIDGKTYRLRQGHVHIPAKYAGCVEAVLGLDNRPQASPHFRFMTPGGIAFPRAAAAQSYRPSDVAALYKFPTDVDGTGEAIGIIELGGGFVQADLQQYFSGTTLPNVMAVLVDGASNTPDGVNGADPEVMLDIEVAGSVAPGANIVVYFAPNTDQGFLDALTTAIHDTTNKVSVISISWGSPEVNWTAQAMQAMDAACQSAAALGVTVTVAAGDNGSSDGVTDGQDHVDFPASSPHVLACGGTNLQSSGGVITSETVWNDGAGGGATGGGVSCVFPLPTWQSAAGVPAPSAACSAGGRGVPDVAGDADPQTGYQILVDGTSMVVGGTSAVAPLWAGLIALLNQRAAKDGKPAAGLLNATLYMPSASVDFNDILTGNNGSFAAGPGWDACTGLGSPIGTALEGLF